MHACACAVRDREDQGHTDSETLDGCMIDDDDHHVLYMYSSTVCLVVSRVVRHAQSLKNRAAIKGRLTDSAGFMAGFMGSWLGSWLGWSPSLEQEHATCLAFGQLMAGCILYVTLRRDDQNQNQTLADGECASR